MVYSIVTKDSTEQKLLFICFLATFLLFSGGRMKDTLNCRIIIRWLLMCSAWQLDLACAWSSWRSGDVPEG